MASSEAPLPDRALEHAKGTMVRREPETGDMPTMSSGDVVEVVAGWALIRLLGEGSTGRIFLCRNLRDGAEAAVKLYLPRVLYGAARDRFVRENRVLATVRAPELVTVLDVGVHPPVPHGDKPQQAYGVFAVQRGVDLETRVKREGRLPVKEALVLCRDVARALDAAGSVGVIHRDLRPGNIWVGADGNPARVVDFGVAAPLNVPELPALAGVVGTPAYLAPELVRGLPADTRSDLYALGATLYFALTGRELFEGTPAEVAAAQDKKPAPSIAQAVPGAGMPVVDLLYRLLQKERERRPQTAREVLVLLDDAIAKASTGRSVSAPSLQRSPTPMQQMSGSARPAVRAERGEASNPGGAPFDDAGLDENPYAAQPTGVLGTLKQMSITEVIQTLEISKKSARVDVNAISGSKGVVFVHDGQIVHATCDAIAGEAAVVALARLKEGFFRIHYEREECVKNVTRPTTFVLLEAMRQIDEDKNAAAQKPAQQPAPKPAQQPAQAPPTTPATPAQARPSMSSASKAPPPRASSPPFQAMPPTDPGAKDGTPTLPLRAPVDDDATQALPLLGDETNVNHLDGPTLPEGVRVMPRTESNELGEVRQQVVELVAQGYEATKEALSAAAWAVVERWHGLRRRSAGFDAFVRRFDGLPGGVFTAAALVAVVVVLVVIGVRAVGGGPPAPANALNAVFAGDAAAVVAAYDEMPPSARSPTEELVRGHALAVLRRDDEALDSYHKALLGGVVDDATIPLLIERLDASSPDKELDLLELWPDPAVEEALGLALYDVPPAARGHALAALLTRGRLGPIDVEANAMLEAVDGPTCTSRRQALVTLRTAGTTPQALAVIEAVGRRPENSGCFGPELAQAFAAVQKRLGPL